MAAYGALVSLMHLIHDLERRPSPPISLDHLQLDSITEHITYFQYFLHSYNIPPPLPAADYNKQVADPLEMRIAGAAYAAEDAIENHIVESVKHKKNYKKENDEKIDTLHDLTITSINRCNGILQSVMEEMNSIKHVVVHVQMKQKAVLVHDQTSTSSVVARSEEELFEESMVHERRSLILDELEVMEKLAGGDLNSQSIPIFGMGARAYEALGSLMHLIHDLQLRPSPPISLDHLLLDSIMQHITYFQNFLHSFNTPPPPPDDNEKVADPLEMRIEVADPLEMRIEGAAYAAADAIENHIVESINHKKKYKKANDDDNINTPHSHDPDDLTITSINRCNGILQSVMEEMNSIKHVVVHVQMKQKAVLVHDQTSTSSVVARSEEELFEESMVHERRSLILDELEVMEKLAGGDLNSQSIPIFGMGARAYEALGSLMHLIHDLQLRPSPPISLDHLLLDSIMQHITYFQNFLHSFNTPPPPPDDNEKVADPLEMRIEVADPLEMRIEGAAYAAADAIENHIVESINHKKKYKKANDDDNINTPHSHDPDDLTIKSINRCNGILQSVIEEMNSIKNVVVNAQRKQKAVLVHDQVSTSLRGVELEVMEKLAGDELNRQVIPIVGMGGIGKTFLAKSIYTKPLIKERFDKCAWATVSQHNDTGEILCELLSQATNTKKEKLSGKSVEDLGLELFKYLFCRRFLIVMDDIWSIDSWDRIQRFFPDNGNSSRVLVTTRLSQLSRQLNNDYRLQMSFLDKASSWNLFSTTVFGEKSSCPPELEEIGEKIVDNCRGLPLSIVVMGGLLKKMDDTRTSWESVQDNITSLVNMEGDKHCFRLLKLSYDHLPVYLKPCFLYMGVFEEDEEIRVSALVPQWVSEGFLEPTMGEALETTARGFLQELIDRNLILIGELGCTGSIKSCKLHDLIRDMCLREGQKEGFYHVEGLSQGMDAQRRVIIPKYTSIENVRGDLRLMSHTRSIICEHGKVALCRNLVLLRKLQAHKKSSLSNNEIHLNSLVFRYLNLRHIAIKSPMMSKLPSVSRLWNLHTLIVSFSFLYEPIFVADFWKIPRFRHFEIVYGYARLPDPPNGNEREGVMENLHTLKGVRNFKCSEEVVRRIPNIKRLKLEYNGYDGDNVVADDHDEYFVGNMNNLGGLEFLSVSFLPVGRISPMQNITFPNSLKKLSLCMEFESEWDGMLKKIALLPLLEKLKLYLGSFENGVWVIAEEEFPSLKYLELYACRGLTRWTLLEESSFILPRLEHLNLDGLEDLQEIPLELGDIDTLQSIKFSNCGEGLVRSLKAMFDEQVEIQDQVSFYVQVNVRENQEHLLSLAGPKFYVKML